MEPGLRALLHANQPGLLPSFLPSACLPAAIPPSRWPHGKPNATRPLRSRRHRTRIGGNPERVPAGPRRGLAAPGGPGRLRGIRGRFQTRPWRPGWQEPSRAFPAGGRGEEPSVGVPRVLRAELGALPAGAPAAAGSAAGCPMRHNPLPHPRPGRRGEGNAELCQLLVGSRGSAALSALHGN